jgi:DNA-binding MarR family transcriptional regulator
MQSREMDNDTAGVGTVEDTRELADNGVGEIAGRLALAIGRINRRIRPTSGGLSNGLLSALASVVRLGPIRPGDLASVEVVSAPTLTRVISELENRGLIAREVDAADRRSFFVEATEQGIQLVLQATSERASLTADLLAALAPEELALISASLRALEATAIAAAPEHT